MSMILIEGVVQVTINPGKLRNVTSIEWHLSVFSRNVIIILPEGKPILVETIMVDQVVTPIIVTFEVEILRRIG